MPRQSSSVPVIVIWSYGVILLSNYYSYVYNEFRLAHLTGEGQSLRDLWRTKWHWVGFTPSTEVFPCQYNSTTATYRYSATFYSYQKNKWVKLGNFKQSNTPLYIWQQWEELDCHTTLFTIFPLQWKLFPADKIKKYTRGYVLPTDWKREEYDQHPVTFFYYYFKPTTTWKQIRLYIPRTFLYTSW